MQKFFFTTLFVSVFAHLVLGQPKMPNKVSKSIALSQENAATQKEKLARQPKYLPYELNTTTVFAVKIWVLFYNPVYKEFITDKINKSFTRANAAFAGASIRFEVEGKVEFNKDKRFAQFNKGEAEELALFNKYCSYKGMKSINLIIVEKILDTESTQDNSLGYAYLPYYNRDYCREFIVLAQDGLIEEGTLVHEFGHFFGLHHTHGDKNLFEKELVSGANCEWAGDSICDTPADPVLTKKINALNPCDCKYTGQDKDPNNNPYHPLTDNIMSYSPDRCRKKFTAGQLFKIGYYARWRRHKFKYYVDKSDKQVWDEDQKAPNLKTAKEDFEISGQRRNVLMVIYHPESSWCRRLAKEISQPEIQDILNYYDYKLIFFEVIENQHGIIDFMGNHILKPEYLVSFQRILSKDVVHFPALFTIRFYHDREKTLITDWNFGYMNPRSLKEMLIRNGQIKRDLGK